MASREKTAKRQRVFIDLTHLGRHVTGLERVSIEQFEKVAFDGADVTHLRAHGTLSMVVRQQLWLPLLALLNPSAIFVFPGFPPSPVFAVMPGRVVMYVHDLFLITRRADLGRKARYYMAPPFAFAVRRLKHFWVNSQKTRDELRPFARADAHIALYRPAVRNVFDLTPGDRTDRPLAPSALQLVALGTVEPRKNYGAALAILDALGGLGHPGARLHIIGRPGWGDAASVVSAHPRITVHGYLSAQAAKQVLESADVYLCTSHDEGLGLPLLEAQYAGLPVVAPDKAVFREALGTSGTFIDTDDPGAAAQAIAALIASHGWRHRASDAAAANVARWNEEAAGDAAAACRRFMVPLDQAAT